MSDWPQLKASAPGGHMPFVEFADGTRKGESLPLMRFLGKQFGFYPTDPVAAYEVDNLMETYEDVYGYISKTTFSPKEAQPAMVDEIFEKRLPTFFKLIDDKCKEGFLVGDSLTTADFFIGGTIYTQILNNTVHWLPNDKKAAILEQWPNFKAYGERYAAANDKWLSKGEFYAG